MPHWRPDPGHYPNKTNMFLSIPFFHKFIYTFTVFIKFLIASDFPLLGIILESAISAFGIPNELPLLQ